MQDGKAGARFRSRIDEAYGDATAAFAGPSIDYTKAW